MGTLNHTDLAAWESYKLLKRSECGKKSLVAKSEADPCQAIRKRVHQGGNQPAHQAGADEQQQQGLALAQPRGLL